MTIFIAFGTNIGNLGISRRKEMHEWTFEINKKLTSAQSPTRIVDWYGHTGNFVIESSTDRTELANELASIVGSSFAVLPYDDTVELVAAVEKVASPPAKEGKRWTSGIAFAVRGLPRQSVPKQTQHAVFFPVGDHAVGAWKEDQLTQNGTLDKKRRGGGWGAVSEDVSRQVGGVWTARSLRTIKGTLEKAKGYITWQSRKVARNMLQGDQTARAAHELSTKIDSMGFDVLCVHRDRRVDRDYASHVRFGQTVCWIGSDFKSSSRLAFPDIAVVDRISKKVALVAEVEESKTQPKSVIADLFSTLLGDHITFGPNHKEELQIGPSDL